MVPWGTSTCKHLGPLPAAAYQGCAQGRVPGTGSSPDPLRMGVLRAAVLGQGTSKSALHCPPCFSVD